jgi:hypothetical protein
MSKGAGWAIERAAYDMHREEQRRLRDYEVGRPHVMTKTEFRCRIMKDMQEGDRK